MTRGMAVITPMQEDTTEKQKRCGQKMCLLVTLFVILLLILVVLIIVIATQGRGHTGQQTNRPASTTNEEGILPMYNWTSTAVDQRLSIDFTVDPCTAPYRFSCGAYDDLNLNIEDQSSQTKFEIVEDTIRKKLIQQIQSSFDEVKGRETTLFKSTIKIAYDVCMADTDDNSEVLRVLAPGSQHQSELIQQTIDQPYQTVEQQLAQWLEEYNVDVLFTITGKQNSEESSIVLKMTSFFGHSPYLSNVDHNEFTNLLENLVRAIKDETEKGETKEELEERTMSENVTEQIIEYEKRLLELIEETADYYETTKKSTDDFDEMINDVDNKTFKWKEFLTQVFPVAHEVEFHNFEQVIKVANFVAQEGPKKFALYSSWRYLLQYKDAMKENFQILFENYEKQIVGSTLTDRTNKCYKLLHNSLQAPLIKLYYALFKLDSKNDATIQDYTVAEILSTIKEFAHQLDHKLYKSIKKLVSGTRASIAYDTELDDISYTELKLIKTDTLFSIIHKINKWCSKNKLDNGKNTCQPTYDTINSDMSRGYINTRGEIILPPTLFQLPTIDFERPDSMNVGAYGQMIGSLFLDKYYKDNRKWINENSEYFGGLNSRLECLGQRVTPGLNTEPTKLLIDTIALDAAYTTLTSKYLEGQPKHRIPSLEHLNQKQLLFIAFAQRHCGMDRGKKSNTLLDFYKQRNWMTSNDVDLLLTNSKYFSDAFNCNIQSSRC